MVAWILSLWHRLFSRGTDHQPTAVDGVTNGDTVAVATVTPRPEYGDKRSQIGIENNNPGNLRYVEGIQWHGQIGKYRGFCVFDTPEHGIRALCLNLVNYQRLHHPPLRTITEIITRWAPPVENDTAAYIVSVASAMGTHPEEVLNLEETGTLASLAQAIIKHENGEMPYAPLVVYAEAREALGGTAA